MGRKSNQISQTKSNIPDKIYDFLIAFGDLVI
jgi:hypothetical protein